VFQPDPDKDAQIARLRQALELQSESLRQVVEERDKLRMAWVHLRSTFAEMNQAIP
jgi:hypothetical protein